MLKLLTKCRNVTHACYHEVLSIVLASTWIFRNETEGGIRIDMVHDVPLACVRRCEHKIYEFNHFCPSRFGVYNSLTSYMYVIKRVRPLKASPLNGVRELLPPRSLGAPLHILLYMRRCLILSKWAVYHRHMELLS